MTVAHRIELAHEPDFRLGRLTVLPSHRELVRDDQRREVIEHRMMQVLIALSKACGEIVTRDELIMSCWDGRVVGDASIHRVVSQLRKVANGIGAGSIEIETIVKIGYRLHSTSAPDRAAAPVVANGVTVPDGDRPQPTRRRLMAGALAGALALMGGGWAVRRLSRPAVHPEVRALMANARQLRDQNSRDSQSQAIALLQRAVALDPDFADGWGMLGCTYAATSHNREFDVVQGLRERARAAARRAMALDPGNGLGELALAIELPLVGHWAARDRHLGRALADRPDDPDILAFKGKALLQTGSASEAVRHFRRIRQLPLTPAAFASYILALSSAGMTEEADQAMANAAALYPTQPLIWLTAFNTKMLNGKPGDALAMMKDLRARPTGQDEDSLRRFIDVATTLHERDPRDVERVGNFQIKRARDSAYGAEQAMLVANALGRLDDAFAIADAYFFSRGFAVPDRFERHEVTLDQRRTYFLFQPVARPMRADARFDRLVEEIGLEHYWRKAGVEPDYRRMA